MRNQFIKIMNCYHVLGSEVPRRTCPRTHVFVPNNEQHINICCPLKEKVALEIIIDRRVPILIVPLRMDQYYSSVFQFISFNFASDQKRNTFAYKGSK